jgi:UDP-glucose 4-epimerase
MRALVLGGCGFIGSHVVDALMDAGHKVRVLDRAPEAFRPPVPGVEYRLASFADPPALAEALEGIEVVVHLISTTVPATSNLDPASDVDGNLIGSLRLLQLMVQKHTPRILFLSSGGTVYGVPKSVPIREDHALRPVCSYGVVKVAIENYLHMFHHLYGLQYVVLRASNAYGERQGHLGVQGVIATFLDKIRNNEDVDVWGDGGVVRDYVYAKDLAQLCSLAALANGPGIYNAGSGRGHSLNEILEALRAVTGRPVRVNTRPARAYDVPRVVLDVARARERFGWRPSTDLVSGLERTWQWMTGQA